MSSKISKRSYRYIDLHSKRLSRIDYKMQVVQKCRYTQIFNITHVLKHYVPKSFTNNSLSKYNKNTKYKNTTLLLTVITSYIYTCNCCTNHKMILSTYAQVPSTYLIWLCLISKHFNVYSILTFTHILKCIQYALFLKCR